MTDFLLCWNTVTENFVSFLLSSLPLVYFDKKPILGRPGMEVLEILELCDRDLARTLRIKVILGRSVWRLNNGQRSWGNWHILETKRYLSSTKTNGVRVEDSSVPLKKWDAFAPAVETLNADYTTAIFFKKR